MYIIYIYMYVCMYIYITLYYNIYVDNIELYTFTYFVVWIPGSRDHPPELSPKRHFSPATHTSVDDRSIWLKKTSYFKKWINIWVKNRCFNTLGPLGLVTRDASAVFNRKLTNRLHRFPTLRPDLPQDHGRRQTFHRQFQKIRLGPEKPMTRWCMQRHRIWDCLGIWQKYLEP
jgi:hypothetical protein